MKKYFVFIALGGVSIFLLGFGFGINSKSDTVITNRTNKEQVLSDQESNQMPPSLISPSKIQEPQRNQNSSLSSASLETATVTKVIDGDTIQLSNGKSVRYIGINTPETKDPRRGVECFGKEASNKNNELVQGKVVSLEKDVSETDKYGRLLRYVYIGDQFINKILVKEGYAYASSYPPDIKYQDQLQQVEEQAVEQQKGLWSVCKGSSSNSTGGTSNTSKNISGDKDCSDFATQKSAQDFFISQGGPDQDPHKLDQDHDGVVCESLP